MDILPTLEAGSVACFISDPPYPMIKRDYGMMTEAAWTEMMQEVVRQARRILLPTGSAVFILQPNSEKAGKMRLWLWEFVLWAGKEWNLVQDAYWWNTTALPSGGAILGNLMRGSVKMCVWLGNSDCYRNQSAVMWNETEWTKIARTSWARLDTSHPSGHSINSSTIYASIDKRGGVTPFNCLPFTNGGRHDSAGAHGHGAGTPLKLADWWTRYLCPPGGTVCDPFMGSGTMGIAAQRNNCNFIGIEKDPEYVAVAQKRISEVWAIHANDYNQDA